MSIQEESVDFSFQDLEDVPSVLQSCLPPDAKLDLEDHMTAHVAPLRELAGILNTTELEWENCFDMAVGNRRLLVLLREPSEREKTMNMIDFLSEKGESTFKILDNTLGFAFSYRRHVFNTPIMDSTPLCPTTNYLRESEETNMEGKEAVSKLLDAISILQPEVILVCHCKRSAVKELGLPDSLFSSIKKAGQTYKWKKSENSPEITVVYCFHPGYIYRDNDNKRRKQGKLYLFQACFMIAANALAGRKVTGDGIEKLVNLASNMEDDKSIEPVGAEPTEDQKLDLAKKSAAYALEELGDVFKSFRFLEI